MPFPDSSGGGLEDDYPINGADNGPNSEHHAKPRSKSGSTRRSSHAGSSSGNGSNANNGSASANSKNVSHVPCKFYRQGVCQAGDSCPFSHEDSAVSAAVCKYFQKGNCKFGARCALAHITPDGRRVNPKKEKNSQNKQSGSGQSSRVPSGSDSRPSLGQSTTQSKTSAQLPQPQQKHIQPHAQSRLGGFDGERESSSVSSGLPTTYLQAASGGGGSALPIASAAQPAAGSTSSGGATGAAGSTSTVGGGGLFGSASGSLAFASPPSASSGHISQLAALAPIGSPPGMTGGSAGQPVGQVIGKLSSPLLASGVVAGAGASNSTHSSFSFAVRPGSAGSTRASSFHSTLVESQLFPASRPGSISRSTGSSVWADRPKNALAYEGSAIVDDDEDELIGEDEGESFEEDLVPPSLSDLLTPQERERRNSRHSSSTRPEVPLPTSANASTTELWSNGNGRYARSSFSSQQNAGSQRIFEPIGTPERTAVLPPLQQDEQSSDH